MTAGLNIHSTNNLEKAITKKKINSKNIPVSWLKIQWLRYRCNDPFTIFYKESLSENLEFERINITLNRIGRPKFLSNIQLTKLYSELRPIKIHKKKDMDDLMEYIPSVHHPYYLALVISQEEHNYENDHLEEEEI